MALQDDIINGESDRIEFKEQIPKDASKIVRTVVAFSNTQGGRIILGVSDDRRIVGVDGDPFKARDQAIDIIMNGCSPTVCPSSFITTIDGKSLVVIEVPPGTSRPYCLKGESPEQGALVRVSASNRPPSNGMLKELMLEGERKSYDEIAYIGRYDDLEASIRDLCEYLSEKAGKRTDANKLVNMGLLIESGNDVVPTRAFMLLTTNPYHHASVKCARFRGRNMVEFIDRKEFAGPLMEQVEKAAGFVMDHINLSSVISGLYRKDVPEIPPEAIRELITNAVIHRSYSIDSENTFVSVFDDRVEITSPGMMPRGMSIENIMVGRSNPRNPVIARFFKEAGLVEGWGSGVIRAFSLCESFGLRRPVIQELDDVVRVTIFRRDSDHTVTEELAAVPISNLEQKVVDLIRENPQIKIPKLASELGITANQVKYCITKLKKRGILTRVGAKQQSRWYVKNVI
jgi:predicted HTH transcriptional regulator